MEINEKSLVAILKEQREEYQRHAGILSENMQSHIQLIAESLSGVQSQLSAICDMVAQNTEDIEIIKMDLHIIKDDIKEKANREELKVLQRRLEIVEKKLAIA